MITTSSASAQSAATVRPIEYRLLPEATRISFSMRHLFGLGAVTGTVRIGSGRMLVDASNERLLSLETELDMTSFDSSSRARDRAVASPRFLDVVSHPTATYRAESADRTDSGWQVRGTLTVKGVAAPVDLMVEDLDPGTALSAHATASVDRFAYGITFPTARASRNLEIAIHIEAERVDV